MNHFKTTAVRSALPALLASAFVCAAPASAQISTSYSLRSHFESLGPNYPAQNAGDVWTFRENNASGALFGVSPTYYTGFGPAQTVGLLVDIGTGGCTPGFCNVPIAETLATFNGVFVHTGNSSSTAVVWRADAPVMLQGLDLWTEGVTNASSGNGITVNASVLRAGVSTSLYSSFVSQANTATTAMQAHLLPQLSLMPGDVVQVVYGSNGNYLYDHFNIEVQLTTSPVPEPGSLALWLAGLSAMGWVLRRQRAV